ncbi:MAG: hypothetical protein JO270_00885, partial [Acidobacteriaceae bacterium]|nr:hypothetical protein [Acidobacteriaceae bacterium]
MENKGIVGLVQIATRRSFRTLSVLTLVLFAGNAFAQTNSTPAAASQPDTPKPASSPAPQGITYVGGQLRIDVVNATMAEVLTRVSALTGVPIDLPPLPDSERMQIVKLGPGSPREILAALLRDSHLNYLIESSGTDPDKLQSVLILPEDKKTGNESVAANPPENTYYRRNVQAQVRQEPEPPPPSVPPAQPENTTASDNAMPQLPSAPALIEPDQTAPRPSLQQNEVGGAKAAALSPPAVLNQDNISQQLQRMYQQRAQINQQQISQAAGSNTAAH